MSARSTCPVCGAGELRPLVSVPRVPVFCNQICRTRRAALEAPTAPIELRFCAGCGHAFNAAYEPARVVYSPEYENSLHCSGTFQRYARSLAARLIERHRLSGKRLVEIGCGQGDFLRLLCAHGANIGFGFDPSYAGPDEGRQVEGVTVFGAPYASQPLRSLGADFVCSRHVLEHVAEPVAFLREIRAACGRRAPTPVFFEVPNAVHTLRHGGIWDLIYEHCGYFTPSSLRRAFVEAGFVVDAVEPTFGGQFLTVHAHAFDHPASGLPQERARPTPPSTPRALRRQRGPSSSSNLRAQTEAFAHRYQATVRAWSGRLRAFSERGAPVAVWGAGSKGATFLNIVPGVGAVAAVVDINPRKQGAFVAGAGQPIVAPDRLLEEPPAAVVVMNSIYRAEIGAKLLDLGLSPAVLVADEAIPGEAAAGEATAARAP